MSEDLSEIMKKMNSMLQNNEIPPDIKNILEQFSSKDSNSSNQSNFENSTLDSFAKNFSSANSKSSNENSKSLNENSKSSNENSIDSNKSSKNSSEASRNLNENSRFSNDNSRESNNASNFDVDTLLKMKSMMDKINQNQPDPRSDLLKSLKPYLRDSRKRKVDEYIKLFRMGKVLEMMNPLGGEKKNDI